MRKLSLLFVVLSLLSACSLVPSQEDVIAKNFKSPQDIIEREFSSDQIYDVLVTVNPNNNWRGLQPGLLSRRTIVKPFYHFKNYCEGVDSGSFHKQIKYSYFDDGAQANQFFGLFGCYDGKTPKWFVDITSPKATEDRILFDNKDDRLISVRLVSKEDYALRMGFLEDKKAARIKKEEHRKESAKNARNDAIYRFKRGLGDTLVRGDSVCTADNQFGYVEDVSGERVKVNIVGQSLRAKEYHFFYDFSPEFAFRPIKFEAWQDRILWSKCNFTVNY